MFKTFSHVTLRKILVRFSGNYYLNTILLKFHETLPTSSTAGNAVLPWHETFRTNLSPSLLPSPPRVSPHTGFLYLSSRWPLGPTMNLVEVP